MGILIEQHGDVREIVLDWPEARNALGPSEGRELRIALEAATADITLGAIVISARGKAFCAGGNLKEIVALAKGGEKAVRDTIYAEFQGIFRAIEASPVPIITAVDGPAIGFGCDLAIAGSATFIGSGGWLSQGWIRAGLIPATGGTLYVARRGGAQAVWRFLAADRVDGPTAERWGLAIASENAPVDALEMAAKLAAFPRAPLKAVQDLARRWEFDSHLDLAVQYQSRFITHPDFEVFARKLLGG